MAHWIIGDVHGCWATLQKLLSRIDWNPDKDRLWLVGDLVNKGTGSLQVLRWAAEHEGRVNSVLGNHDVHLLARAESCAMERAGDTLQAVLGAANAAELLAWLKSRPLVLEHDGVFVVHAGVLPSWSLKKVRSLARRCELDLVDDDETFADLYRAAKRRWNADIEASRQRAAVVAIMTTIRLVDDNGGPVIGFADSLDEAPPGSRPWFSRAEVKKNTDLIVFGHWANLGLYQRNGLVCLDTGCVYGGCLSAIRVDDHRVVQVGCAAEDRLR